MLFENYIGIDYSGAATPASRLPGIQVYVASREEGPVRISPANTGSRSVSHWNRLELHRWLTEYLPSHPRSMVGIDHGLSFPMAYFNRYQLRTWPDFLDDFVRHWPTDRPGVTVEQFRAAASRVGRADEFRLTERWTSSAKSVFQFDVQGSVAKSTHAGLPFVSQLRRSTKGLVCWPFDGWSITPGQSVLVETYPSLFRNRYERLDRSVDQQDAYAVCHWLQETDALGRLGDFFNPPLTTEQQGQALLEGWIFGVY